jgi:hypothetical protein
MAHTNIDLDEKLLTRGHEANEIQNQERGDPSWAA